MIRTTTRLVEVSVVVQDKNGNPITGLTKEDFKLFDQGKQQSIALFSGSSPVPASVAPRAPLPPNMFTNRFDQKGEEPGAVTVILFDTLNTSVRDQQYVRKQILRFLQTLKPQDHVALYALTTELLVLHDFTQDDSALVTAVGHYAPKELAAFDASNTPPVNLISLGADPQWANLQNAVNNANAEIGDQQAMDRVGTTAGAIEAIADHVASIPGHKSLVWVSGGFPIQLGTPSIGGNPSGVNDQPIGGTDGKNQLPRADRDSRTFAEDVLRVTEALNRANLSIYPVDAKGVEISLSPSGGPEQRDRPPERKDTAGLNMQQDARNSSQLLADRTGGIAFFGSNDVSGIMRRAMDDGRFAYTLGFYPDHGKWDGKFRKIKIEVKDDGARLHYRQGYFAGNDQPDTEDKVKTELQQAAMSPLDATVLGMIVGGKAAEPPAARNLDLRISLDPTQFLLTQSGDRRVGALDLFFLQRDAAGNILIAEKQHLGLNFEEKQYEVLAKAGIILERHLIVQPQAAEIRVVVRDASSDALGSVTVPVKAFFPVETSSAATGGKPQ